MDYELISEEEYASLPIEDSECFVAFESICRRNMNRMINSESSGQLDYNLRQQYMSSVVAVAAECGIDGITYDHDTDRNFEYDFGQFLVAVQSAIARIRIRRRSDQNPYSVLLTQNTRTRIEHYVSRIRDAVTNSDMDADRKQRLFEKLDQLLKEISAQRVSFAKTMAIFVAISAITPTAAGFVTIAADGENAISQMMRLIGRDKETEKAAAERLAPPPKGLPAPTAKKPAVPVPPRRPTRFDDADDDIPF